MTNSQLSITTAISWCLAWGDKREPKFDIAVLKQMRQALNDGKDVPEEVATLVEQVKKLQAIPKDYFPQKITELRDKNGYEDLWNQVTKIGLVYGGATKIKQYVFEEAKLPDIRGASTRLDQINLVDLPTFFYKQLDNLYRFYSQDVQEWLDQNYPQLSDALIPELIIYSSGGNILAFCPTAYVDILTNAIEKRYTERTITANSCAVGDSFRILELHFGLLRENLEDTFWLEQYQENFQDELVQSYFGKIDDVSKLEDIFFNRKSFNELTTKLAILFNQRRAGNDTKNRPSRRYPPMLETHPYLRRDETEKRSAITKATNLPGEPYLSETTAIKRQLGDRAKNGTIRKIEGYTGEYIGEGTTCENWIERFEKFLNNHQEKKQKYFAAHIPESVEIPESLTQIGKVSNGYIAYIYADGNNMGGAIQKIRTPKEYQDFSEDVDNATKYSVFQALADNLHPRELKGIDESSRLRNGDFIHPFEIITIGGDDILLIVPADKALGIAKMIGEQFEEILLRQVIITGVEIKGNYELDFKEQQTDLSKVHRYSWQTAKSSLCKLSISSGVLITAYDTPIYYAEKLISQLLKSAKKYVKDLKKQDYYSGTVDFLVMKAVTMISSNISEFRSQGLIKSGLGQQKLKLYAAPYTLHELGGLLETAKALKTAEFPKSQLYQIRSLLERGKQTAMLNYRYFRVRLAQNSAQKLLKKQFEEAWCKPKDPNNNGNLAPWMSLKEDKEDAEEKVTYETIWRELVDLYPFIEKPQNPSTHSESQQQTVQS